MQNAFLTDRSSLTEHVGLGQPIKHQLLFALASEPAEHPCPAGGAAQLIANYCPEDVVVSKMKSSTVCCDH